MKQSKKAKSVSVHADERKQKMLIVLVICVAVVAMLVLVVIASVNQSASRTEPIKISVANATGEKCVNDSKRKKCSGTLTVDASLSNDGNIPQRSIEVSFSPSTGILSEESSELQTIDIPEKDYSTLKSDDSYKATKTISLTTNDESRKELAVYELTIIYNLSENDKVLLSQLNDTYQKEKAEKEAKQKAEAEQREKEWLEREQAATKKKQQEEYENEVGVKSRVLCLEALSKYYFPSKASLSLLDAPYMNKLVGDIYYYYFKAKVKSSAGATVYQNVGCQVKVDGLNLRIIDFWEDHSNAAIWKQ